MLMFLLSAWMELFFEDEWVVGGMPSGDESGDLSAMDGPSSIPPKP